MKKIFLLLLFLSFSVCAFSSEETFERFRAGTVTYQEMAACPKAVLFLWTSRCPYCIKELKSMNLNPDISKYAKFYFVNLGESKQDVARTAKDLGLKPHILDNLILDEETKLATRFDVIGVPTFIYLRHGKIAAREYYFNMKRLKEIFGQD